MSTTTGKSNEWRETMYNVQRRAVGKFTPKQRRRLLKKQRRDNPTV